MVKEILTGAGLIEGKTFNESRFIKPPQKKDYAVYLDNVRRRGADNLNLIEDHDVSIELYEYSKNPDLEAKIEAEFDKRGIEFEKMARYWLEDEQLYQVVYDFNYTKKGA